MSEAGEAGLSQPPSVLQPEVQPVQTQEKPEAPILQRLEDVLKLGEPQTEPESKKEPEADPLDKTELAMVEKRNPVKDFFTPLKNKIFQLLRREVKPEQTAPETRRKPIKNFTPLKARLKLLALQQVVQGKALNSTYSGSAVAEQTNITVIQPNELAEIEAKTKEYENYKLDETILRPFTDEEKEAMRTGYIFYPSIVNGYQYDETQYLPEEYFGNRFVPNGIDIEEGGKIWTSPDSGGSIPFEDMIYNSELRRSREAWEKIVNYFNVDDPENIRYNARNGKTYCNIFLSDVLRAFEIPIPHFFANGQTYANQIYDYLAAGGEYPLKNNRFYEWKEVTIDEAGEYAEKGIPVVFTIKNLTGGSGHVALISSYENGKITLIQAGAKNGFVEFDEGYYSDPNYSKPKLYISQRDDIIQNDRADEVNFE